MIAGVTVGVISGVYRAQNNSLSLVISNPKPKMTNWFFHILVTTCICMVKLEYLLLNQTMKLICMQSSPDKKTTS